MKWWMWLALVAVVLAFFFPALIPGDPRWRFSFALGDVLVWSMLTAAFLVATWVNKAQPATAFWEFLLKILVATAVVGAFLTIGQMLAGAFGLRPLEAEWRLLPAIVICAFLPALIGDLKVTAFKYSE